jgi:hypothetical protein
MRGAGPEPLARDDVPDEPPPVLGRWSRLYALVIGELLLVIALCGWLNGLR